ncbi:MAG: Smr/MutS family protein, partial [Lachnospiraceae bacterium]|nr:Smr/MutS family protein [Lachnospiraceae bacterium]
VKLNNDIRELELNEEKEIEVILATLSGLVADQSELIIANISILTSLDFIFARAMLSKSYNGFEPDFNADGIINIRKGRHPLLDPKKVVPIDIRIGRDFDLLVISGPNTGGKTVSLKTAGLFTLMGQAGLHIPAAEHSELSVFTEVFADIGDEQSIEQSLSTFSSHMTNIVSFWEQADEHSLVLFDELGAGTDPTEGAALATAILSDLHARGIRTIATTHYSELKVFALDTPGVENACCEFDVETLRPTYRLLIGVPGKSNAFAISKRLGLPDYIIENAKGYISQEAGSFEDVVAGLENTRLEAEKELERARADREEASRLKGNLESRETRLSESREKILAQAREEAYQILRQAKEYADETIRRYNKLGGSALSSKEMERERNKLRERIGDLENDIMQGRKTAAAGKPKAASLKIGDSVRVISMNLKGTVSTLPDKNGKLFVQMGILRSQVSVDDLELLQEENVYASKKSSNGSGKIRMSKSSAVSTEINLLGMTTDEALSALDKYMDDAYIAHLPSVRIVHGKGTGTLRKAVHNYLRKQRHVDSFRLGEFGEGDTGVTIVKFK